MNAVLNLGKYLFALPFLVFGIFHLMGANDPNMNGMAYGQPVLVYLTGVCLIGASVSIMIGKLDKLATVLLGVMLILLAVLVHLQGGALEGNSERMSSMLKDLALAGAAWMYATTSAKDNAVIG